MIKWWMLLIAAVLIAAILAAIYWCSRPKVPEETRVIDGQTYRLTFQDDFRKFDRRKWEKCPEWKRGNVGGSWDDSQVRAENGYLILSTAINDEGNPISGAVRTRGKFQQAQGYFECRCQVQKIEGLWTAFWLMCDEEHLVGNGAADGAEIDIMESYDLLHEKINHGLHWDGYGKDHRSVTGGVTCPGVYEGFHTFALLWTEKAYIFSVDGKETYRVQEGDPDYPGCCQAETYLKLTVEVGTWAGWLKPQECPHDSMIVDYVKVYQKV